MLLSDINAKSEGTLGEKEVSDLKKFIAKRKKTDKEFAEGFEEGYEQFKIGVAITPDTAPPTDPEASRTSRRKTDPTPIETGT